MYSGKERQGDIEKPQCLMFEQHLRHWTFALVFQQAQKTRLLQNVQFRGNFDIHVVPPQGAPLFNFCIVLVLLLRTILHLS